EPGELALAGDAAAVPGEDAPPGARVRVRDHVHVDLAGVADGPRPDARAREQGEQPAAPAGPQDELGGVLRLGESEQCVGDLVADDMVVRAVERLDELPLPGQV